MKNLFKLLILGGGFFALFYTRAAKKLQGLKIEFAKVANVSISGTSLNISFKLKITNPNRTEGITLDEVNLKVSDTKGNSAKIKQQDINLLIPPESIKSYNTRAKIDISDLLNIVSNLLDAFSGGATDIKDAIPKSIVVTGFIKADNFTYPINETLRTS